MVLCALPPEVLGCWSADQVIVSARVLAPRPAAAVAVAEALVPELTRAAGGVAVRATDASARPVSSGRRILLQDVGVPPTPGARHPREVRSSPGSLVRVSLWPASSVTASLADPVRAGARDMSGRALDPQRRRYPVPACCRSSPCPRCPRRPRWSAHWGQQPSRGERRACNPFEHDDVDPLYDVEARFDDPQATADVVQLLSVVHGISPPAALLC